MYGFRSNEDVANHIANNGDLDAVFSDWSQSYTIEGWDAFYNAVRANLDCMDVVQSSTGE